MSGTSRPPRPLVMALAALAAIVTVAGPAAAVPRGRVGVGDSIMLSAADELAAHDVAVNAEVGRQFEAGVEVVRRLVANDGLPRHVVVHLGTNGPVSLEDCLALVAAAPHRRIYLVNVRVPRWWQDEVNETLRACARPLERVRYLDWWRRTEGEVRALLATDGYHLNAEGQRTYAAWIDRRVDATVEALRSAR